MFISLVRMLVMFTVGHAWDRTKAIDAYVQDQILEEFVSIVILWAFVRLIQNQILSSS
jgi:hypothetical protein